VSLVRNTGVGHGLTYLNRLVVTIVGYYELLGPGWGTEPVEIFPEVTIRQGPFGLITPD